MRRITVMLAAAAATAIGGAAWANDYPTDARVSYVIECMGRNGNNAEMLERCSCTIDAIAETLPYERYVQAKTVLEFRNMGGEKAGLFRTAGPAKQMVERFLVAQKAANEQCFRAGGATAGPAPTPPSGG